MRPNFYLLLLIEIGGPRDEDTWGWHLLDAMAQGFDPKYTIADGGAALEPGQKAVMPNALPWRRIPYPAAV